MKRLLFFTFSVILLLVGFGCSKDSDTIQIPEQDSPVEGYVAIDWEKTKIASMDLKNGKVILNCSGKTPDFINGRSIIVLKTDTSSHIRRVMEASISSSTATLQTIEADMTELFADTEFSFSFEPSVERTQTKSGTECSIDADGILHPVRIVEIDNNSEYKILYDIHNENISTKTDAGYMIKFPEVNNSGKIIAESSDGNLSLYWDTYKQNISLNINAYFKFGKAINEKEITKELKVKVSELEEFSFAIKAEARWNLILGALAKGQFEYIKNDIILIKEMFKPRVFYFLTPAGVPVTFTMSSDLLGDFSINGDANMTIKGGVSFGGSLQAGIDYTKATGWKPVGDAKFNYEMHPIQINSFANLNIKASAYPRIKFKLYNLLGPAFSSKPFVKDTVKAGIFNEIGSVDKDYYGWTEKGYAGIDLQTDIMLDFIGLNKEVKLPPIIFEREIYNAPDEIKLKSPDENVNIKLNNEPVEVIFNVTRKILGINVPVHHVSVKFESEKGNVDKTFGLSGLDGNVTTKWTPIEHGAFLTAKVYDDKMNIISETALSPQWPFTIIGTWKNPGEYRNTTFYPDGTFVKIQDDKDYWEIEVPQEGYKIYLKIHEEIRGSYIFDLETKSLITKCTYHYQKTWQRNIYSSGEISDANWVLPNDDIGKDLIGGSVKIFYDGSYFNVYSSDGAFRDQYKNKIQ